MGQYYTMLAESADGIFKDRGSKFFAYACPALNIEEVAAHLERIKKDHPKARHHCYAYRLGESGDQTRANDDGEPSGTAGKPILGQLVKRDLTFTLVVVVRYFGGTKLGVAGLINAYREAALDALTNAKTKTLLIGDRYTLITDYPTSAQLIDEAKKLEMEFIDQQFTEKVTTMLFVPRLDATSRIIQLMNKLTHLDFDTIEDYQPFIEVVKN
jgi:uncharacterized YigZ family protein